ncbi:hypothetical protein Sant_1277 [Sodalis praecaptivus]|uniref:Uncharacterized protein n=1 Tax=Sodalis praecaptivus TaxID=1239307 RepID=W0HRC6_9GAMM|nr:hypothetical protein [Sodalis praecaptivus]AHF76339.1 hypothetical protein Sant_1277 [Sodalis praecaptivus]
MIKTAYFLILLYFFSLSAHAISKYTLLCPGRNEMTVMHTHYRITTLMWDDEFFVAPLPNVLEDSYGKKRIYRFLNHDTLIADSSANFYYFIFHNGKEVRCTKGPDLSVAPLALEIVH